MKTVVVNMIRSFEMVSWNITLQRFEELDQATPCDARHMVDGVDPAWAGSL